MIQLVVALVIAASVPVGVAADTVKLRAEGTLLVGTITRSDEQTLTLETPSEEGSDPQTHRVPWTEILSIVPAPPPGSDRERALRTGQDIWRAHRRLERSDAPGARRLLEPHESVLLGRDGPVSAMLAETLLAASLWLGDWSTATIAWIALLDTDSGDSRFAWVGLDPESRLVPALPPFFVSDASAESFVRRVATLQPLLEPGSRASTMAELYTAAASARLNAEPTINEQAFESLRTDIIRALGRDEVVLFTADVVCASLSTAEAGAAARDRLQAGSARRFGDWATHWASLAVARSLAAQDDEDAKRLGIVTLLDTALRAEPTTPALAARAWQNAARTARMLGDDTAARLFEAELTGRYPDYRPASHAAPSLSSSEGPDS